MNAPKLSAERPPQLLHWLARKAGMPDEQAQALWRQSLQETGDAKAGSKDFWKRAMDRLLEHVAADSLRRRAAPFGLGPLLHLPAHLWLMGLQAGEAISLAGARRWREAQRPHFFV